MRSFIAVFFLVICSLRALPQQTSNPAGKPDVYAVVVGVSNYQDPDVPKLQFANRDAGIFADFLQSKAGGLVPKENIRLLIDSNATVAAVHMAIRWLVRTCKKDDLVFFYFSGHGDLESMSMFNNAYLICYNTPIESYVGMSLSVTFLNDIANTLSAQTEARVVLITDACHSGKMANRENANALVGQQLMNAKEKEIRIASSQADQLSNENTDWGGGRGVFSYYLVNGLKGLADNSKDGIVTLGEIKNYLQNSMATDAVLKQENKVQTPVFKGADAFELVRVDAEELTRVKMQSAADSAALVLMNPAPVVVEADASGMMADDYFISLLKKQGLESVVDSLHLDKRTAAEIPVLMVRTLRDSLQNPSGVSKLDELLTEMQNSPDAVNRVKEMLVIAFDDKVQEVINQYLKGDEAELERRRYYNIRNNGYDVYPRMLAVALQLTDPSSFYHNILQVKLHYFTGVTLRLRIPLTEDPAPLIEQALAEQNKALALEKTAAYIYNELGNLYLYKKKYSLAEQNYLEATRRSDKWSVPWSNLAGLYALLGKFDKGFTAEHNADSLQPGMQNNVINRGLLNELSRNLLYAEEDYRKAIEINDRHFFPFERLGYVYMNTTDYAAADSFLYEADLRKKGYHFKGNNWSVVAGTIVMPPLPFEPCPLDTAVLKETDFMAFFYWGMQEYYLKNYDNALRILKRVITANPEDPLVFHYIGKIYFDQQKWEEAEVYFQYAMNYYLNDSVFHQYVDSVARSTTYPYEHDCFERFYRKNYYSRKEDLFFIARVYERWNHYEEADKYYHQLLETEADEFGGYIKLWQLNEKMGRYLQAENVIIAYSSRDADLSFRELNAFYRRMIDRYPDNGEWYYKLGLLLHGRSEQKSMFNYVDTLVWFPKLNKEVFIDVATFSKLGNADLQFDQNATGVPRDVNNPEISRRSSPAYSIPGTREYLELADDVYTPRMDGIRYLERAGGLLSERPILAEINYKIGEIYTWAGSKRQAFPYFKKSLGYDPANANTRMQIVTTGTAIYRNREVLEQLRYLYDSNQINLPCRLLYAEFAMNHAEFDRSRKLITGADEYFPYEMEEIYDLQGRLNTLLNKNEAAIKQYKRYLELVPDDPDTEYSIARLYARQGKKSDAFTWMKRSIKNGFNYSFVLETDPSLVKLRQTAQWKQLMATVVKKDWKRTVTGN